MTQQWYSRLPIARKLWIILMLGSVGAIVCFGAIYVYYGVHSMRKNLYSETQNTTDLLGSRNVAAIRFKNPEAAAANLKINGDSSYKEICLYSAEGKTFARHPSDIACPEIGAQWNGAFKEATIWSSGEFSILRNILADGEIVGAIRVVRTEQAINDYVMSQLKTMAIIAGVCVLLFLVAANYLQKLISKPIIEIAKDAQSIVGLKNFEGRLNLRSQDELGQVAEAFNKIIAIMETRMKELSHRHQDVSRAYAATLDKLEEMAQEFLETADSVLVYSEMTAKRMFGPSIEKYLPYQADILESLDSYNSKFSSLQRIAHIYKQSLEEPKSAIYLRQFFIEFVESLNTLPVASIEQQGQMTGTLNGPQVMVYKRAWDELFRILSNLVYTLAGIIDFTPSLKFDLPVGSSLLTITFGTSDKKPAENNMLQLCKAGELYEECTYIKNSIEDPDAGNEFLDDEILQRPQFQYILDSIAYIAGANAITFHHNFEPGEFKVHFQLEKVLFEPAAPMVI